MTTRACWSLLLVASCATPPVQPARVTLSEVHDAGARAANPSASALTFAPWDGVYVVHAPSDAKPLAWVRTLAKGISLTITEPVGTATQTSANGGWHLDLKEDGTVFGIDVNPPEREGLPWHIEVPSAHVTYEQRIGALEARVRARLSVGARFVRIAEGEPTRDVITVLERGMVRVELDDGRGASCGVDVLMPMVDRQSVPVPSPLPEGDELGVVEYMMLKVDRECSGVLERDPHGVDGGLSVFADRTGSIAGLLVSSYEYAEIFAAPRATAADLDRMRRAASKVLERQAE